MIGEGHLGKVFKVATKKALTAQPSAGFMYVTDDMLKLQDPFGFFTENLLKCKQ